MKLLLNACCSNEYADCRHFLVSFTPKEIVRLREMRDACAAFLNQLDPGGYGGSVDLPFHGLSGGDYSFENIPDGHYEDELDRQEWTLVADDTEFDDTEFVRTECGCLRIYRGGDIYVRTLFKYTTGSAEALLYPKALDALIAAEVAEKEIA